MTDLETDQPELVYSATKWPSNAELIADVARLGYLKPDVLTLDPTYGRGTWWKQWQPDCLVKHDRKIDGSDFRDLPYPDDTFHQIAYDPPYVCVGGRKTTGIADHHDRFGLTDAPKTPDELQQLINDGLDEMRRLITPRGTLLVKCQNYITSGHLFLGAHDTLTHALKLGFRVTDWFEHLNNGSAQPKKNRDGSPRRQVHARRNHSTLYVLRAPR